MRLTRNWEESGQLLESVLLNCSADGVSLWPVYRKPFDLTSNVRKVKIGRGARI